MSWIDALAAFCSTHAGLRGGVLIAMFAASATGGVAHCAPLCGGFVLGQVADPTAQLPANRMCEWYRLHQGLLLPYHLGRMTSYATLGALAGSTGLALRQSGLFRHLSPALLVLAAALCLPRAFGRQLPASAAAFGAIGRLAGRTARIARRGTPGGEFLFGLALGFLPCGLLHAAVVSSALAGPVLGALAMALFAAGAVPALAIVGILGAAAGERWGRP